MQTKSPDIIGAFQLLVRYLTNNFTAINRYKFYIGLFLGCWMIGFGFNRISLIDQGFRAFLWIFGFRFGFSRILDQRVFLSDFGFWFFFGFSHSFGRFFFG
jgi:hypothetical protein